MIFLSFHNILVCLIISSDQQYQRPFEDDEICLRQNYLHLELSLVAQLDGEVHRKLNGVVKIQTAGNILTCISQENLLHISFPRFYQDLILYWEILVYSLSIRILILFCKLVQL